MTDSTVIVVEGYHDQVKVNQVFPNVKVITTNGSEISNETINLIFQLSLKHEVVLFLDPDYPGKRIMQKILDTGGQFSIATLQKKQAISKNKKKVGIEHASKKDIFNALNDKVSIKNNHQHILLNDLMIRGLANQEKASILRKKVCQKLNIPFSNAKTFLKYINLLNISLERIDQIIYET
jgi:ribonuclease M5